MYSKRTPEEILQLFHAFAAHHSIVPQADELVDWFGIRVPISLVPHLKSRAGTRIESPPYPDDGFRATFIEYLAVVDSITAMGENYAMAEVGASYGPFSALCATLALRRGARKVVLRAVEAARNAYSVIHENYARNGLLGHEAVDWFVLNAAVEADFKTLFFPDVDCVIDNGASVQEQATAVDIRGAALPMMPVQSVPLQAILALFPNGMLIDLLHVDIQGAERKALPGGLCALNERVKRLLLATHSRRIEGEMIDLLSGSGWELVAEEPCGFSPRADVLAVEGWTTKDGTQYWINRALI